MDTLTGTDLGAMHTAIATRSAQAFPGVHFEFYREDRTKLPTMGGDGQPTACCLLDLVEFEPSGNPDPGTEQAPMLAKFEGVFVMPGVRDTRATKIAIRALAGSFAGFLRRQIRWPGVINGVIMVTSIHKDDYSPELDQYEAWRVEWAQEVRLGAGTDGLPDFTRPTTVFASFVPIIGIPHVDEYVDIGTVAVQVPS